MTLLQRLGPALAATIAEEMIRCRVHGRVAWVWACPCVLAGEAPAALATYEGAYCAAHLAALEAGDPVADANMEESCIHCLSARGVRLA